VQLKEQAPEERTNPVLQPEHTFSEEHEAQFKTLQVTEQVLLERLNPDEQV
jgi:hypothetical protein